MWIGENKKNYLIRVDFMAENNIRGKPDIDCYYIPKTFFFKEKFEGAVSFYSWTEMQ